MPGRLLSVAARPLSRVRHVRVGQVVTAGVLVLCVAGGFALRAQEASAPNAHTTS